MQHTLPLNPSLKIRKFHNNGDGTYRLTLDPIHKQDDPEDISNYYPVSHTYIIHKIFEKILKKALRSFVSEATTISLHQHGFLPHRPCLSNLIVFVEAVTRIMDEDHMVAVIYLDFAKTFDAVNHRAP